MAPCCARWVERGGTRDRALLLRKKVSAIHLLFTQRLAEKGLLYPYSMHIGAMDGLDVLDWLDFGVVWSKNVGYTSSTASREVLIRLTGGYSLCHNQRGTAEW